MAAETGQRGFLRSKLTIACVVSVTHLNKKSKLATTTITGLRLPAIVSWSCRPWVRVSQSRRNISLLRHNWPAGQIVRDMHVIVVSESGCSSTTRASAR
jgi:hypothetical protein